MADQASGLRLLAHKSACDPLPHPVSKQSASRRQPLFFANGKGGAGTTMFIANLTALLAARGATVRVQTDRRGGRSLRMMLGLPAAPENGAGTAVRIASAGCELEVGWDASRTREGNRARRSELYHLIELSGGSAARAMLASYSNPSVCLLTTPEPTAIADTIARAREIAVSNPASEVSFILNRVHGVAEVRNASRHLIGACSRLFRSAPRVLGAIPEDDAVPTAVKRRTPLVSYDPQAPAHLAIAALASGLCERGAYAVVGRGASEAPSRAAREGSLTTTKSL